MTLKKSTFGHCIDICVGVATFTQTQSYLGLGFVLSFLLLPERVLCW